MERGSSVEVEVVILNRVAEKVIFYQNLEVKRE